MKTSPAMFLCVVAFACGPGGESAPAGGITIRGDTTIISGPPSCRECRIELDSVVTLGNLHDPVTPDGLVIRMADGRFFASGLVGAVGIAEYDSAGRFVRVHGRRGAGPGEYGSSPQLIVRSPGDTLVVYDSRLRRFSLLGPDGSFVSSIQSPIRVSDFTVSSDGAILVGGTADPSGSGKIGPAVYVLGRDGGIVESFGDSVGSVPENPLIRSRSVAVSRSGMIAAAKRLAYEIELFFPDGSTKVLLRDVPWFTPTTAPVYPATMVTHVWLDESDRLWTSVLVPDSDATDEQIHSSDPAVSLKTRDFVIEVFDLRSARLLASRRFTGPLIVHQGLATAPSPQPDGNLFRHVWIPRLTQSVK